MNGDDLPDVNVNKDDFTRRRTEKHVVLIRLWQRSLFDAVLTEAAVGGSLLNVCQSSFPFL